MPRPQYNRMQERVYRYLREQDKPKTAHEIVWWYKEEYAAGTKGSDGYYTRSGMANSCLLYTSPSPRDKRQSRMPSSA